MANELRAANSHNIPVRLKTSGKSASLDAKYGPYTTQEEALISVPESLRAIGLTIGILQFKKDSEGEYIQDTKSGKVGTEVVQYPCYIYDMNDTVTPAAPITAGVDRYSIVGITEYWWKKSIDKLEKKGSATLTMELVYPSPSLDRLKISENTPIRIRLEGEVAASAILVYEVIGGLEYLTSYNYPGIIPVNAEISLDLNINGDPKTTTYRIKVIDLNSLYAKTIDDLDYLEFTVDYKEIAITNLAKNNIESLKIKNVNNLLGKTFTFRVSYIDSVTSYNVRLYIGDTQITTPSPIENLGNDSYKVTLPADLSGYGGLTIKLRVIYDTDDQTNLLLEDYEVVSITAPGVFNIVGAEFLESTFYWDNSNLEGIKTPFRLYFEAEQETSYTIESVHTGNQVSDFSYSGRVTAYTWNTIYITPTHATAEGEVPKFVFKISTETTPHVATANNGRIILFTKQIYSTSEVTPSDPRTTEFINSHSTNALSYILDIDCFINWTAAKTTLFSIANITIDKDGIRMGSLYYTTPLQRNVHLGFEYLVQAGTNMYSALYIDGVLCKNIRVSSEMAYSEPGSANSDELPGTIGLNPNGLPVNNIMVKPEFVISGINLYSKAVGTGSYLSPFTNSRPFASTSGYYIPIILNNYEFYRLLEDSTNTLPILKLEALPIDSSYYTTRNNYLASINKDPITPSKFGSLTDGQEKYTASAETISQDISRYNILLKLTVDLKSTLQKATAVLCRYEYIKGGTVVASGLVEVHTQGTSTLAYRLPNFKFTFLDNNYLNSTVQLVPKIGESDSYYTEEVLTAKTDYMDSSHLNNTPTATYYNKVINSGILQQDGLDGRSPSSKQGGLDAITGIPIIMLIKDVDSEEFINYGSFMLNVDKTGHALKFSEEDGVTGADCLSFEGTSNELSKGLSSRFILPSAPLTQASFNAVTQALNAETAETNFYTKTGSKCTISSTDLSNTSSLKYHYYNVLTYLALGLEYRYPDSDIIKQKGTSYNVMPLSHFKRLFRMYMWVANSPNLSKYEFTGEFVSGRLEDLSLFNSTYPSGVTEGFKTAITEHSSDSDYPFTGYDFSSFTEETTLTSARLKWIYRTILNGRSFEDFFNKEYCAIYFIFLMVFGLTDNLGKNCMFDQWFDDGDPNNADKDTRWYPRPYDLDSLAGLNNNGLDIVPPFVELSPRFSLNYNLVMESIPPGATLEEITLILETNHLNSGSLLPFENIVTQNESGAPRYSYSSASSNLWFTFYDNYADYIRDMYRRLRGFKVNNQLVLDTEDSSQNTNNLLSVSTILRFFKEMSSDLLGISLYNLDFQLKYLGDTVNQKFGFGNRSSKFDSWITKRILFCDVYFYYRLFIVTTKRCNASITFDSPQYIVALYLELPESVYFYDLSSPVALSLVDPNATLGTDTGTSGLIYRLWLSPEAILATDLLNYLQSSSPKLSLDSLTSLSIYGETLANVLTMANSEYLSTLIINELSEHYTGAFPPNILNITLNRCTEFPDLTGLPHLKTITLTDCNAVNGELKIDSVGNGNPVTINVSGSVLNLKLQNTTFGQVTLTNNTINRLIVNDCTIPELIIRDLALGQVEFGGTQSDISILDLRECSFTTNVIDLSIIASNLRHLLLNDTVGLTSIISKNRFSKLAFLGLMGSEVLNLVPYTSSDNPEELTLDCFDASLLAGSSSTVTPIQNISGREQLPKIVYKQEYNEKLAVSTKYISPIVYSPPTGTYSDYYAEGTYKSGTVSATSSFKLEQTNIVKVKNLAVFDSNVVDYGSNCTGVSMLFNNCDNLLVIESSNIRCSGVKMFNNCNSLERFGITSSGNLNSVNRVDIKIDTDATAMFASCNALVYGYIENVLNSNSLITNFTKFLYNKTLATEGGTVTINLGKYSNATNMTKAFCVYIANEKGYTLSYPEQYTVTISGLVPSNVTTLAHAFEVSINGYPVNIVFNNWNTLLDNCSSLTDIDNAFFRCAKSNNSNSPLSYADFYVIPNGWIPNSVITMYAAFAYAKVIIGSGFRLGTNVRNCGSAFYACPTYSVESEPVTVDVSNVFLNASSLESAILCFYNNSWATTSSALTFSASLTKPVTIPGILACSNGSNYPPVSGVVSGKYTSSITNIYGSNRSYRYIANPYGASYTGLDSITGIFLGRRVFFTDNTSISISSNSGSGTTYDANYSLSNMFRNTTILLEGKQEQQGTLHITVTSPITAKMFQNANLLGDILDITLSEGIYNASYMLSHTSSAYSSYYTFPIVGEQCQPPKLPSTISNAEGMFMYSPIDTLAITNENETNPDVTGINYLSRCTSLQNVSYMFYGTKLKSLPYDPSKGLIPSTVQNVTYMFRECRSLKGGIPNNLFGGANTTITDISGMFALTCVMYNLQEGAVSNGRTPLDISAMLPNVNNVSYLFYYCNANTSNIGTRLQIAKNCFINCVNLNYLFAYSASILYANGTWNIYDANNDLVTSTLTVAAPKEAQYTFAGLIANITLDWGTSQLSNITGIAHIVSNNTNVNLYAEGETTSNSPKIDMTVYNLLARKYMEYTDFNAFIAGITMKHCLGRILPNSELLDDLHVPSTNSYKAAQNWFEPNLAVYQTLGLLE